MNYVNNLHISVTGLGGDKYDFCAPLPLTVELTCPAKVSYIRSDCPSFIASHFSWHMNHASIPELL